MELFFEFKIMLIINLDNFFSGMFCLFNYLNWLFIDFKFIMNDIVFCFVFVG